MLNKNKLFIGILLCCFIFAAIITFVIKSQTQYSHNHNHSDQDNTIHQLEISEVSQNEQQDNNNISENTSEDIKELESLLGDMIDGDIGDALDMVWSNREIVSDFSDYNNIAKIINQIPIKSNINISNEQSNQLYNSITKMVFSNGNNDYDDYFSFLKESGEIVHLHEDQTVPEDPWKTLTEDLKYNKEEFGLESMWKGFVLEGSNIQIFKARSANLPIGQDLYSLRGAIRTFGLLTDPPISLNDMLEKEQEVLMADVTFFISHNDLTGGVIWPYIVRYWFDPVNKFWRVEKVALFRNRNVDYRIAIVP